MGSLHTHPSLMYMDRLGKSTISNLNKPAECTVSLPLEITVRVRRVSMTEVK